MVIYPDISRHSRYTFRQPDAMTPTNAELRQFIVQFFSDEELDTLAFDYFPEATNDFGGGMSKSRKVIALIGHCERRGRLSDLHAAVARERKEGWNRQFVVANVQKPNFSEETRFLNERDPRQIFLSHATADAEFAHTLAADLRAEGWRVWIAPESIRPGEKWVEAIDRGLETSGVFVVVLTPAAVASRWVRTETNAAIALEHRDRIHFLPLDVVKCDIPLLWSGYQFVPFNVSYEKGLDALLRRLEAAITGDDYADWLKSLPDKVFPGKIIQSPTPEPLIPSTMAVNRHIHEKTGIELMRIPAGPFLFGSTDEDKEAYDDEKPQRTVELPEYWISRYPLTNAQYKRFVDATGHEPPLHWEGTNPPPKNLKHPVVYISWDDAKAFCDWAGLALPSEEEWEKAARGTDGRIWPWGNEPPTDRHGNFNGADGHTTPAGRYSPLGDSPYGCADMAGNVWEWTESWYGKNRARRVVRGGAWINDYARGLARAAYRDRHHSGSRLNNLGCRLVRRPPSPAL